ncbi:hypothetical protein [Actinokineospora globicatena]|uniref:hypothetical protein n=1 Tax=Actinokineospora globicatena TaxID=103729 RepID=UPI0020A2EDFF|nr:hypothetical protein [Actinokineospora globicatena]MCP2302951.1 hypothetical protein [Actinokineospora globicatena]GLW78661.1 hypothetical protein Aglo01_31430 [Actinokineospora globicatena]GLW84671.1 hypothetical protein Aglo02_23110 [Actinokineospora globicatena]
MEPKLYHAILPVEFSQFLLFDHFSELNPGDIPRSDGHVHCGAGGVRFIAHDQSIRVQVRLVVGREFDGAVAGHFTAPSGRVLLCATTASPDDVVIDLGSPGRYAIQATRVADELAGVEYRTESWELAVRASD